MPRPGYCASTAARMSAAVIDRDALVSQSAMYFFMKSIDRMSRVGCVRAPPLF